MFNLLFKDKKISSFEQFIDNFDLEAVKMYYLGGSLVRWTELCGQSEIARQLKNIDPQKNIDEQLAFIFDKPSPLRIDVGKIIAAQTVKSSLSSFILGEDLKKYACFKNSYSSFSTIKYFMTESIGSSFTVGNGSFSDITGSFNAVSGSFLGAETSFFNLSASFNSLSSSFSYNIGSFGSLYGSFSNRSTSFMTMNGSFLYAETSFRLHNSSFDSNLNLSNNKGGSFNFGIGSFNNSSFMSYSASSSFMSGSRFGTVSDDSVTNGSMVSEEKNVTLPIKTPEEKITENLSYCPLNRFGYGIHLI